MGHQGDAREAMLERVSQNPFALQNAPQELKGDREVVMKAVSMFGSALRHAAEELQGDREIVMQAVSRYGPALRFATEELKGDHEIVRRAVCENGLALEYATKELKDDGEMIQHALGQSPDTVVGLKVVLLSGRCCHEIFSVYVHTREDVLRRCAAALNLDPGHIERSGTFMRGDLEVRHLSELTPGKLHEITLVLT